jgi:hypothetical protein
MIWKMPRPIEAANASIRKPGRNEPDSALPRRVKGDLGPGKILDLAIIGDNRR